jgi:FtsH-binding integral membrane protein
VAAPVLDMVMFSGFLAAAVAYRRRSEAHKRLILFTGYSFAFIGLVRYLARIPGVMENLWLASVLLVVPIALCIAFEAATRRSVHIASWIGLSVFAARLGVELLAILPLWLPIGRVLVRPFV